jgi:hypothetical protein
MAIFWCGGMLQQQMTEPLASVHFTLRDACHGETNMTMKGHLILNGKRERTTPFRSGRCEVWRICEGAADHELSPHENAVRE